MWIFASLIVGCTPSPPQTVEDPLPTVPGPDTETGQPPGTGHDDDLGLACAPIGRPLPEAAIPTASLPFLTTSNGLLTATYVTEADGVPATFTDGSSGTTSQRHQLATLTEHLVRNPTQGTTTRDLLWDAYWGVRIDGVSTWLNTVPEDHVGYEPGTGIVRIEQSVGDARIVTRIFAPMQPGAGHDLAMVVELQWTGAADAEISLLALHNAHSGGEGTASGEIVTPSGGGVLEARGADRLLHTPLVAGSQPGAAPAGDPANPWARFGAGGDLDGTLLSGDDVAVGFQWTSVLAGGGAMSAGTLMSIDQTDRRPWIADRTGPQLVADELAEWAAWHALDVLPPGLSADEAAVAAQSLAVLRMAQVREPGPGHGQILASLPPGGWNISWPRDAAYAIVGLIAAGHADEAREALDFMVRGQAGDYAALLGISDYLVSVARYHGDGTEESDGAWCVDGTDAGPNVELDDWGLFLWAYGAYADADPDDPWIAETLPAVLSGVADPLVALIDPANDLLVADSSIWERHQADCFPNGKKQFAYSSIQAVAGLRIAAELAQDPSYDEAAERIRAGLLRHADQGGPVLPYTTADDQPCAFVASSPEETCAGCGPYDGSVIEIVNHGIVRPESTLARGTLAALQDHQVTIPGSPGFLRADDGTGTTNPHPWYDDQEWVVIDLRMVSAYAAIGRATGDPVLLENATTLLDWITAQARANHDLLGELLSDGTYTPEDDADHVGLGTDPGHQYAGSAPMCGFGPGAYLLALQAVHAP